MMMETSTDMRQGCIIQTNKYTYTNNPTAVLLQESSDFTRGERILK